MKEPEQECCKICRGYGTTRNNTGRNILCIQCGGSGEVAKKDEFFSKPLDNRPERFIK